MNARTKARISPHGIVSLLLAAGVLTEGFLRGELIAVLTGLFLLVLHGFSFLTVLILRFRWNGFAAGTEERADGEYVLVPLSSVQGNPKTRQFTLFGSVSYRLCLRSLNYGDTANIDFPLPDSFTGIKPILPPRGRYKNEYSVCVLSDPARFYSITTKRCMVLSEALFQVPPSERAGSALKTNHSAAGNTEGASSWLRSEELYETRQFRPGDDRRKINWRVYAHSGELVTREGELLPPPSMEYSIVFWVPGAPLSRKLEEQQNRARFDELVSRAAAACRSLLRSGKNLRFPQAENLLARHDNPLGDKIVLSALTWPSLKNSCPFAHEIASTSQEQVLCFTLPPSSKYPSQGHRAINSDDFEDYTRQLPQIGAPITFYVGPIEKENRQVGKPNLFSRIIFFPEEEKSETAEEPDRFVRSRDIERFTTLIERSGFRGYPF